MERGREKGRERERRERERGERERKTYLRFLRNLRKQCVRVRVYGQYLLN